MNIGDIPTRFQKYWAVNAGTSFVREVAVDSQIGINDGWASYDTGFVPVNFQTLAAGGVPPFGADMNGVLKPITQWLQWVQAGGAIGYNGEFATAIGGYPLGAVLASTTQGKYWRSTANANATDPDGGSPADWTNLLANRLTDAITGTAHTFSNSEVGLQIERSNSGTAMADLLPGTGAFLPDGSILYIRNNDVSALYVVQPDSGATLDGSTTNFVIIGPGQALEIQAKDGAGTYVTTIKPDRARLQSQTSFFLGPTGSDLFPGITAAKPFLTRQHAWDFISSRIDLNAFEILINIADGVYSDAMGTIGLSGLMVGQTHPNQVTFTGNIATPANVVFSPAGSQATWFAQFGAMFTLAGMTIQSGSSHGIEAAGTGATVFGGAGVVFGACAGAHCFATFAATIALNVSYTIIGSAAVHWFAQELGIILAGGTITLTITGVPLFTTAFAYANRIGFIEPQSITYSGIANGPKYRVTLNSVIDTGTGNVNLLPGSTAGVTGSGGQYN